ATAKAPGKRARRRLLAGSTVPAAPTTFGNCSSPRSRENSLGLQRSELPELMEEGGAMKLRGLLFVTALIVNLTSAKANAILPDPSWNEEMASLEITGEGKASALEATPESAPVSIAPLASKDKVFASAYFDTLRILAANNACSDFFGGPQAAADV